MNEKRLYLPSESENFTKPTMARQVERDVYLSTDPRDFGWIRDNIPCQVACPVATNIPGYIRTIYEERYGRSYELNRFVNIFPGVLGRICSKPCESKCRHGWEGNGEPVAICHLKRVAADNKPDGHRIQEEMFAPSGKSVAIIGAGPAGLGAAHDLAIYGHKVVIYDAMEEPGGMLRYGIPPFRLPRKTLDLEIDNVLRLGVEIRRETKLGKDIKLDELLKKFDSALVAAGTYKPNKPTAKGVDLDGVYTGLEFMMKVNSGEKVSIGDLVQVIGGGYTAMDCARAAMRLGAKRVVVNVLSSEEYLLVDKHELFEVKYERVELRGLATLKEITGKEKVEGVNFLRNRLGGFMPNGEREGIPIEGSEFIDKADSVILAIGQRPDPSIIDVNIERNENGSPKIDAESGMTSIRGLFLAGDFMTGARTIIESLGSGRRTAKNIDRFLMNTERRKLVVRAESAKILRERNWDFIPRQKMLSKEISARMSGDSMNTEVDLGLDKAAGCEESKRCYLCYLKFEIDASRCIFCRRCIDVAPKHCIVLGKQVKFNPDGSHAGIEETNDWREVAAIAIDNKECIRCGKCHEVCPVNCIDVVKVEMIEHMTTTAAEVKKDAS